ncbi:MAG: polysaccharide export protein [Bacteroidales bacterium]|nr:polysaccharide export protein [Bacteroidales bacterium]
MKRINISFFNIFLIITLLITACTPTRKLKYVQNKGDDIYKNQFYNDRSEKTIQPYDYLYIQIYSLDEKTNAIFNYQGGYAYDTELLSYTVDDDGNISLPFVGAINVKDLTITEAKSKIEKSLGLYLRDISVILRYVSNKITILGEVNQPGQYAFFDEKVTVFQALGFANGISTFGDRSDITLIREKDNNIKYYYLDLTKKSIAESDYYYLLPNDILIVNPVNAKYRELRDYSITLISSLLSTITTIITLYYLLELN